MTAVFHSISVEILDCSMPHLVKWHYDRMYAPYWRFYWNAGSGARVVLNNRTTRLDPSRCVVIPPHTPFSARLSRPVDHFCLHFVVGPPYNQVVPGVYSFPAVPHLVAAIREVAGLLRATEPSSAPLSLRCSLLAHEALARIPAAKVTRMRCDERVEVAIRIMEGNLASPPSTGELARRLGMHVNTLIRLFKEVTGHPPHIFFDSLRIGRACIRLCRSGLSIKEVAEETGFCDACHFSRVFRKVCGISPARYRARMLGPNDR